MGACWHLSRTVRATTGEKRREIDEDGETNDLEIRPRRYGKEKLNQSERNAFWLDRDTEVTIYRQRSRRVIKIYTEYISRT